MSSPTLSNPDEKSDMSYHRRRRTDHGTPFGSVTIVTLCSFLLLTLLWVPQQDTAAGIRYRHLGKIAQQFRGPSTTWLPAAGFSCEA